MSNQFDWNKVISAEDASAANPTAPPPATGAPANVESMLDQLADRAGSSYPEAPAAPPAVQQAPPPAAAPPANDFANMQASPFAQQPMVEETFAAPAPQPAPQPAPAAPPAMTATPYEGGSAPIELPRPESTGGVPRAFQVVAGSAPASHTDSEIRNDGVRLQQLNSGPTEEEIEQNSTLYNQGERARMNERVAAQSLDGVHLDDILRKSVEQKASDIHITVGLPPMMRVDGEVIPHAYQMLKGMDTRRLMFEILTDDQVQKFETSHELDFSYSVRECGRFRVNVYMQRGVVSAAIRAIPTKIPSFGELGLPEIIRDICDRTSGLILVTGPTGSGKSTTIATMINDINEIRSGHIITIEDPIEYLHQHKKCMVNQRELHSDTYSFHNALRAVLREDPDIILVGELRDLETIEAALTLAETGHLVFGTLHTRNAPSTIDRIVDVFPSDQQDQIRVLLGNTIEGVISQQLLPKIGGGRIAAQEIMLGSPGVKNLIREGKTHQMYSIIETGRGQGMQTMDSALCNLYRQGICTYEECAMRAVDRENFARLAKSA